MYIWLSFASRGPMMKKAGGGPPVKFAPGASNPPPLPDPGAAVGTASADMARLKPGRCGERLKDGTSLEGQSSDRRTTGPNVVSYRDPERRSHRVYMWGQAPFLHSLWAVPKPRLVPWMAVSRVLRPRVRRLAGWTFLNADVFSASRSLSSATSREGTRLGRLQRARPSALERGPTSTIKL